MPDKLSCYKAPSLLLIQILFISSSPFWDMMSGIWLSLIFPALFALSGLILTQSRRWLMLYLVLVAIHLFAAQLDQNWLWGGLRLACTSGIFYLLFSAIVRHSFFKANVPQFDRTMAGISGYLLLGLFWFLQFTVCSAIQHDAVYNQILETAASPTDRLYFSFVTLTTLGYGDIIPASQLAKVITIFTSLSGVLYISVFVAALVSKNTK